jgi:RimJ/RimL family protein N-acetyltransferase
MAHSIEPRYLEGERLYLRDIRREDVTERYVQWLNDPEVNRYLESRFAPSTLDSVRAFVESKIGDRDNILFAIVLKDGERHIGNIKLGGINWHHRFADVALMVGERAAWGHGYGSEAIALVTRYAFDALGLQKLTAGCYASNAASAKAFLKVGWVQEAIKRHQWMCDGRYEDGLQLAIWRDGSTHGA